MRRRPSVGSTKITSRCESASITFAESSLLILFHVNRKKAYEKKRREGELAAQDKARGEDEVGESSVQLGLLAL
jgi:hypothetical protein